MIFVVLLITGLIWWYPKKWNKSTRDKSFKIKWGASFKRVNLDLHNILGFYALLFLVAIALTGMAYGIKWYSEGMYWVISGGDKLEAFKRLDLDSTLKGKGYAPEKAMDMAWEQVMPATLNRWVFITVLPIRQTLKPPLILPCILVKGSFIIARVTLSTNIG